MTHSSVHASAAFGGQTMVGPLRRVLVRSPRDVDLSAWEACGWLEEPDPVLAAQQHDALCSFLESAGAEVIRANEDPGSLNSDAVYVCDPAIMSDHGALVLRPGKESRRGEARAIAAEFRRLEVPIALEMEAPATAEGGDTMWLDERTLLVGRSYRTNDAGVAALQRALPDVEVFAFDLPHQKGEFACLHLMSLISPLRRDLVVAYVQLLPIRLMELLKLRAIDIVPVPDDEYETMGPNVLALAPGIALAVEGNPGTRRRMEQAGVEVFVYPGSEISHKGEGGPTCLTRPLLRRTA